tara:strand:- start:3599 stop:3787 length:189 start_codon:yes stop_codon:yes gene_type:complete
MSKNITINQLNALVEEFVGREYTKVTKEDLELRFLSFAVDNGYNKRSVMERMQYIEFGDYID